MTPEVVLLCGVGGVGKTTMSAAVAIAYAQAGHRVVVVTVDPARRLADALGVAVGREPTQVPFDAPGTLHALMVDPEHTLDDAVARLHPDREVVALLRENRYYRAVAGRLAGTPEYMALETLWTLVEARRWDVIVVDTPPASDALDVFRAPRRLARIFGNRVLWVLLRPTSRLTEVLTRGGTATLSRLVGGTVVADIGDFFRLAAGMAGGFVQHAKDVSALLSSPRARTILVVDANAPDRADATGFLAALRREGPRFAGFVVNRVVADPGVAPGPRHVPAPEGVDPIAWEAGVRAVLDAAAAEAHQAAAHREVVRRLAADGSAVWTAPRVDGAPDTLEGLLPLARGLPPNPPATRDLRQR